MNASSTVTVNKQSPYNLKRQGKQIGKAWAIISCNRVIFQEIQRHVAKLLRSESFMESIKKQNWKD